jgi:hypothetical protein
LRCGSILDGEGLSSEPSGVSRRVNAELSSWQAIDKGVRFDATAVVRYD